MFLVDKITIPTKRKYTNSGQLIVPCAIARTGIQQYTADSLGIEGGDKVIDVYREESAVFDSESISTFRSIPVTVQHPVVDGKPTLVTSKNSKELQVGVLEGLPTRDEDLLTGTLVIADQDAIEVIESGTKELSVGYTCDVVLRDGKYYQNNIVANHVAIVEKGRAGASCVIADTNINQEEEVVMADKKVVEEEVIEKEAVTVDSVTAQLDIVQAKLDASLLLVDNLKAEAVSAKEAFDAEVKAVVAERTEVIALANTLVDSKDYSDMSVLEIKASIVADSLSIDLTDRSPEYIQARLDILVEDSKPADSETALGKQLNDSKVESQEAVVVDAVADARKRMIERNK